MIEKFMEFLSKPVDFRPMGLYRIGMGLIIGALLVRYAPHYLELFSDGGFHLGPWDWLAPPPSVCLALIFALGISTFLMTVGLFTRLATATTLIVFTFLYGLDTINEKALSSIIIVNLSIGLFSPWGESFSVSNWNTPQMKSGPTNYFGNPLCIRLWQVELLQMYFFAGVMKTHYESWFSGKVLKHIFMGRWASDTGLWLSKTLPDAIYPFLTLGTIIGELLLPFLLLWPKTRLLAAIVGIMFHLSIETTLRVEWLGVHSILCLLLFFWPEGRWDWRPLLYAWVGQKNNGI